MAKPTPEQLAKINRFTKSPLSADDVHVHEFRLIGTKYIPSRFLTFDRSLLDKYLPFVENGDVVQIADHTFGNRWVDITTLPFGRFFEGEIVHDGENYQLDGLMYMKAGQKTYVGDFTTDDISQQLDAGILHDNSVSVTWGFSECSICGNDIRDYEQCRHWPGRWYDVDGGAQRVQCHVIAKPAPPPRTDNSSMIENSIVCAGAYPDAGTLGLTPDGRVLLGGDQPDPPKTFNNIADLKLVNKDAPVFCCLSSTSATFQVESENLRDASELHQIYHDMYSDGELPEGWTMAKLTQKHKECVKELLDTGHDHVMTDALDGTLNESLKSKSTKGSDNNVDDKEKLAFEKQIEDLKTELSGKDTALADKDAEITTLKAVNEQLKEKAELGEQYRKDAIEDAIKAGVRDQGNDFDEETFREMFAALDIEKIKSFAEKWEASAIAKLGITRHTKAEDLGLPDGEIEMTVDPNLYKVGR